MLSNHLKSSKPLLFAFGLLLLFFVGIVDVLTGVELSFSIFYLIPISIVVWFGDKRLGLVIALLSTIMWLTADLYLGSHLYSHSLIPFWNALVRFGYFLIVVFATNKARVSLEMEKRLSRIDFLTGLATSRSFNEYLNRVSVRCFNNNKPLTIAFIDCDNFKLVNDTLGHQAGDRLLRSIGDVLRERLRITDLAARLGGDEFAIALPEENYQAAREVLNRLQKTLQEVMDQNGWPVTFSIGAITFVNPHGSVDLMIKQADEIMYSVKRTQKNMLKHEMFESCSRN